MTNGRDETAPVVMETPKPKNPLLTPRMVNAFARIGGCLESDPDANCDHRVIARKTMQMLDDYYRKEKV